jgi:hypothetical protein
MKTHPFEPLVFNETTFLFIGTLPPESARFYFSNSHNTRLWDIINSISLGINDISIGSNEFDKTKKEILIKAVKGGITDIIYNYTRTDYSSTKDDDIIPISYNNILELTVKHNINRLFFVYQNAYKWFKHSLTGKDPVPIRKLTGSYTPGFLEDIQYNGRKITCVLLPAPLNRGRAGETLQFKLNFYRDHIL